MNIERRLADAVYRSHFGAFVYAAFEALNPNEALPQTDELYGGSRLL
jgi:hypothetical protein